MRVALHRRHRLSVPAAATDAAGAIAELRSVHVDLGGRHVLDDVSFVIEPGSFTGLIGANGAGKTTVMRVILGLQRPSSGEARVLGHLAWHRRGGVGYVPQRLLLDPDVPIRARDVVALGLDGHRLGVPLPNRARQSAVEEMLEAVDATRFADTRVGRLSGGEQQRVLIAHALVSRPRLLLLDEPLANLDLRSGHEVVGLLARIVREQRVAVLLSAHDMNPLLSSMDRIVYVAGGRAASGTTAEVVRADVLSSLYGHRVEVLRLGDRVIVVAGGHPDQLPGRADDASPVDFGVEVR